MFVCQSLAGGSRSPTPPPHYSSESDHEYLAYSPVAPCGPVTSLEAVRLEPEPELPPPTPESEPVPLMASVYDGPSSTSIPAHPPGAILIPYHMYHEIVRDCETVYGQDSGVRLLLGQMSPGAPFSSAPLTQGERARLRSVIRKIMVQMEEMTAFSNGEIGIGPLRCLVGCLSRQL